MILAITYTHILKEKRRIYDPVSLINGNYNVPANDRAPLFTNGVGVQVEVEVGMYGPAVGMGGGRAQVSLGLSYGQRLRVASIRSVEYSRLTRIRWRKQEWTH